MNIDEINVEAYNIYAIADTDKEIKVYKKTPSGENELTDYDVFSIGSKQLIAFKTLTYNTDHCYKILSNDNSYKKIINFYDYQTFESILNESYEFEKSIFWIMDSVSLSDPNHNTLVSFDDRCDTHTYGPIGFYGLKDGTNSPIIDVTMLSKFSGIGLPCISSLGNIHIVKLTSNDHELNDSNFKNYRAVTATARTLTGALRLALEWAAVANDPWNNTEGIAIKSKNFVDDLDIPQDVIDEIFEYQVPMPVSMYLSGDGDARRSINENTGVPPLFKNWFVSSMRSKSLNLLVKNYPETLSIPSSILKQEKEYYESVIYSLLVANGIADDHHNIDTAVALLENPQSVVPVLNTSVIIESYKRL
jgi:hypothetical protein